QDRRPLRLGDRFGDRQDLTSPRRRPHLACDDGQATVELALLLPIVVVVLLGMVQVALVGRDQLALELAAREAARAASVAADPSGAARTAAERATSLQPLDVATAVAGDAVSVTVAYRNPTDVALIGQLITDV